LGRAAQRVDDALELDQEPVTGGLDDAAVMPGNLQIDQIRPDHPEARKRALLVVADQT
jgi:hypothetical protein